jgi:7-methyl-GTP pyrophosphatase
LFFKGTHRPEHALIEPATPRLILASTSVYRRELVGRLRLPFEFQPPDCDETRAPAESAESLARRLARAKAESVAARSPGSIVIGSDQVAVRADEILGKPGNTIRCVGQLRASSGHEVEFLTAVSLVDARDGRCESHLDRTRVLFRHLSDEEIARYVAADTPLDCAGGFKAESLGIALFERIDSEDPTALTGLPLIWLSGALRRAGIPVP